MFTPPEYLSEDRDTARTIVEAVTMGTLVTSGDSLYGSPLPFMFYDDKESGGSKLVGHMDRRNPLWRDLRAGKPLLVVFWGPNAYISPDWYQTRPRVPTWYYITLHVTGVARIITDADRVSAIVSDLSTAMEKPDSGWDITQVAAYRDRIVAGIVGIEIVIATTRAQIRLGQPDAPVDRAAVYAALHTGSPGEQQVADWMIRFGLIDPARR